MTVVKNVVKDRVFQITAILAVLSLFLARPHLADINFSTLWSLLGMMTIIQIFEYLHVLDYLTYRLTSHATNSRQLSWFFVLLSFVGAMFLTNDMAVLTCIPLYLRIARKYDLPEIIPVTAIAIAANLGSALTPFGNPHNIFLMSKFHISLGQFGAWVWPLVIADVIFLALLSSLVPKRPVPTVPIVDIRINPRPTTITCIAALLVFVAVFGVIPQWVAALVVVALAAMMDHRILGQVDYAIIFTFVGFFVIVSDISQVPVVVSTLKHLETSPVSVYLTSIVTSQVISNVPSTVLVARFSNQVAALFYGTNIGGLGTLVASLCNLLAFKQYGLYSRRSKTRFLVFFTFINFVALAVMGVLGWWLLVR